MHLPVEAKIRYSNVDLEDRALPQVEIAMNGVDFLLQAVTTQHNQWRDLVEPYLARGDVIAPYVEPEPSYIDKRTKHLDGGGYGTTREQFAMFDDAVKASTETDVREKMIDGLVAVHASRMEVKIRHPKN